MVLLQNKRFWILTGFALLCSVLLGVVGLNSARVSGAMESAARFLIALTAVNIASLGASEAFRLACARLTSIKRMAGSLILSMLMCFLGGGIVILIAHFVPYIEHTFDITRSEAVFLPISAAIYAITRCFCVWFSARKQAGRAASAALLPLGMLIASLLIGQTADERAMLSAAAEGISLLIVALTALKGRVRIQPCGLGFKVFPLGILRLILYPLLAMGLIFLGLKPMIAFGESGWLNQSLTHSEIQIALLNLIFGMIALSGSRFYYRLDDMDSENGVFYAAAAGTLLFGNLLIAGIAGVNLARYAVCASVYLLANAVWACLYVSARRWYLAALMLIGCFSGTALSVLGIQNALALLVPECALFLIAALLSSRAVPEKRRFA